MKYIVVLLLQGIFLYSSLVNSQSIVTSLHNLSASGPGQNKTLDESGICEFCHLNHDSHPKRAQWNKSNEGKVYILYNSSTLQALPGQPDGSSIMCLSCHDGTTALGHVISQKKGLGFGASLPALAKGKTNLSTDLSDDHPISFVYDSYLASSDGELKDPSGIILPVSLEKGKLQCTSCHNPHKNTSDNFLVATTQYSELCLNCHQKNYWLSSGHRNSNARWNGSGINPWFHTDYKSVSENGCENCHKPHSAGGKERLMKYEAEENNCLDCHSGNVAEKNIQIQFSKPYKHDIYNYRLTHDANENALVTTIHIECVDCHNPHATTELSANAPYVRGSNIGTAGIDQGGLEVKPVQYEYEICYRCHADSPNKLGGTSSRQIEQNNVRLEFDQNNPSFHPVAGPGKNTDVPSLIAPYTTSSVIYCTDCHASDGRKSPKGLHGSIYPQILKYKYDRNGKTYDPSYTAYELCYACHDMKTLKDSHEQIRKTHAEMTSCNTCHDPHGISYTQGNITNNAYLINFNTGTVTPNSNSVMEYTNLGSGRGSCSLKCHNHDHDYATYPKKE